MAPVLANVEAFVTAMGEFLQHLSYGGENMKPRTYLIEAAWRYAFNEPGEGCPVMSSVEQYHEVLDVIYALTTFEYPGDVVSFNFDNVGHFEELAVLYYMLNARIKIDYAILHGNDDAFLTVRDLQLLSSMRESSVRNAISATSGRKLNSILTKEGQRLIPVKDASAWLENCRWYQPTDLEPANTQEFLNVVNDCLDVYDVHEG
jgi:hypothetical protein